jgi:hypothetical protein
VLPCTAVGYFSTAWYLSLLQHRGAIWFKALLQPNGHNTVTPNHLILKLPSFSEVTDAMQSWLAPVIAMSLWLLLATGTISRGWYTFYNLSLVGLYGIRAFVTILQQRVTTLKRVSAMVKQGTGTVEDQRKRQGFVKRKTVLLVFDLTGVATATILLPASLLFLGSSFSSRQFAIHETIVTTPILIIMFLFLSSMKRKHKKPSASNRSAMVSKTAASSGVLNNDDKSMVSGLSEISKSQF